MTSKPNETTKANETANDSFNKGAEKPARPEQAKTATDANKAAEDEFNRDDTDGGLTKSRVGGLRGSPD